MCDHEKRLVLWTWSKVKQRRTRDCSPEIRIPDIIHIKFTCVCIPKIVYLYQVHSERCIRMSVIVFLILYCIS
jgi:hypothetical protein